MKTADYLAAVKAKLNITSSYALGKALKVSKQVAGKYDSGEVIPGPVVAFRVAEILGEQPAAVVAQFELERAERAENDDDAAVMKGWLTKVAGGAMSILLAAGLGGFSNADARLASAPAMDTAHIVSKKKRRWFDGLGAGPGLALA